MRTKFLVEITLGPWPLEGPKVGEYAFRRSRLKNGRRLNLVLNPMQWRILIALNMNVLHVEC